MVDTVIRMAESQSNSDRGENRRTATVPLTNTIGLHARPAIQLTKLAKRFASQIQIRTAPDSPWIDAKSIVQVMAAKAPRGTLLEIAADGEDAREALQDLVELIQDDFGEKAADSKEFSAETGHIASRGIAMGKAVFFQKPVFADRPADTVESETRLLRESIQAVSSALGALIENAAQDIAEVLEFQLSLVRDPSLIDPVLAAISNGSPAHSAWAQILDEHICQYEESDELYFRGRASDLGDLKQQVLNHLYGQTQATPSLSQDAIIIAEDLAPSDFAVLDQRYFKGLVLQKGSINSHVALLARSRGIPMLVGLNTAAVKADTSAILDAVEARLISAPDQETLAGYRKRMDAEQKLAASLQKYLTVKMSLPAGERIYIEINVGRLEDLKWVSADHCDGIGLVRTEFLFDDPRGMPDEEKQFAAYKELAAWAQDKPVIVRTLDAGGDKPIEGLTEKNENNPFLGIRGIRLSLSHEDVFRTQLRALVRASAYGNLKIMLPMVTVPQELEKAKKILQEIWLQVRRKDPQLEKPPLGIMVEVPAAAMCIEDFDADFFSIGSNDLIQYVTACDRGEGKIDHIYTGANRAVFELIRKTIENGRLTGKQVSLCGDMAAQTDYVDALLDMGLRHFSVAPADLARVKAFIANKEQ